MTYWHVAYYAFGFTTGFMVGMTAYFHKLRDEQDTTRFLSAATTGDKKMPVDFFGKAESVDEFGGEDYFPPTVYEELENL